MLQIKYKLYLQKKTAKLNREFLKVFVNEVFKEFGGHMLLSNVSVQCNDDNTIDIDTDEDNSKLVHGSLLFCGLYKNVQCCFREIE